MENDGRVASKWVRGQVLVLALLLVAAAGYRFIWVQPAAVIDVGFLVVAALVVILILSESFDSFSVGKLLSVSREVKKKEKEVEKLETQNSVLLSQLISLSNHQSQSQTHTNVYGDYLAGRVEQATPEEVLASQEREAANEPSATLPTAAAKPTMIDYRASEAFAIQRYAAQRAVDVTSITRDAKLVFDFRDVDRISNTNPIFDGYIKKIGQEIFLDIRINLGSSVFRDRLYMMLSKIDHYRSQSGTEARLDLVIFRIPSRPAPSYETGLLDEFRPAIANNLLTVTVISVTAQEEKGLLRQG